MKINKKVKEIIKNNDSLDDLWDELFKIECEHPYNWAGKLLDEFEEIKKEEMGMSEFWDWKLDNEDEFEQLAMEYFKKEVK